MKRSLKMELQMTGIEKLLLNPYASATRIKTVFLL